MLQGMKSKAFLCQLELTARKGWSSEGRGSINIWKPVLWYRSMLVDTGNWTVCIQAETQVAWNASSDSSRSLPFPFPINTMTNRKNRPPMCDGLCYVLVCSRSDGTVFAWSTTVWWRTLDLHKIISVIFPKLRGKRSLVKGELGNRETIPKPTWNPESPSFTDITVNSIQVASHW